MKNLLKLSLLLSAFVAGGLNAVQIKVNGEDVIVPNEITLVNDLGVNANVEGKLYAAGTRYKLNDATLKRLKGSIKVQKMPNGEVGYIRYLTIPVDYDDIIMESDDKQTINLSEAFTLEAR